MVKLPGTQDIENVRKTWEKMIAKHELQGVGLVVLTAWMNEHKEIRQVFAKSFPIIDKLEKDVLDLVQLNDPTLNEHGTIMASSFGKMIECLDDTEFVQMMIDIGKKHTGFRVSADSFDTSLNSTLITALMALSEEKEDSPNIKSWKTVVEVMKHYLKQGLCES